MATKGSPTVVVRLPQDERERWAEAAKVAGVSLSTFVRQAVERAITGEQSIVPLRQPLPPLVDPRKCVARVRAGSYCRRCGTVHVKGNIG